MVYNHQIAVKVAEFLLDIKAIQLSPENLFTWASGIQSPIYCDNRKSLSYPEVRTYIKNAFQKLVNEKFKNIDAISGVATAGIAHGALLADALELPFSYIRSKPKGHGLQNLIEGEIKEGSKVLVVEDLISTGMSSLKAVDALKDNGVEVVGLAAIFTYGFAQSKAAFLAANCPYYTLSDFDTLLKLTEDKNIYDAAKIDFMRSWKQNKA